jgi:methyltransferase (TIGR00027 family)
MEDQVASTTSLGVSRMRAIHTRRDPQPILHDPWGDHLVPVPLLMAMLNPAVAQSHSAIAGADSDAALARMTDDILRASPAYTNVITRSRYTEDALGAALARGVRQYVLIGAGFDSYALRRPPQAADLQVFEIDHPATQALKKLRIAECGITVEAGVHFVATDLAREGLETALSRTPFNRAAPTFFSWLGVTMYLTRAANMAALKSIVDCSAAGSELVFSYIDQKLFEAQGAEEASLFADLVQVVSAVGEPFISGFHPAHLADDIRHLGLVLVEDLNDFQLLERYDPEDVNGLKPADRSHIARVLVRGAAQQ